MEGRATRKNPIKGEDELHSLIKNIITTMVSSEEFINKIAIAITDRISNTLRNDLQKLKEDNARIDKRVEEQDRIIKNLLNKQEKLDEATRNHNIIFYGIQEREREICNKLILDILTETMKLKVNEDVITTCFRIGKKISNKSRPILVKFSTVYYKELVYKSKKSLKPTNIVIREDLTPDKVKVLKATLNKVGRNGKIWTHHGNVYVKLNNSEQITRLASIQEVERLN